MSIIALSPSRADALSSLRILLHQIGHPSSAPHHPQPVAVVDGGRSGDGLAGLEIARDRRSARPLARPSPSLEVPDHAHLGRRGITPCPSSVEPLIPHCATSNDSGPPSLVADLHQVVDLAPAADPGSPSVGAVDARAGADLDRRPRYAHDARLRHFPMLRSFQIEREAESVVPTTQLGWRMTRFPMMQLSRTTAPGQSVQPSPTCALSSARPRVQRVRRADLRTRTYIGARESAAGRMHSAVSSTSARAARRPPR